MFSRKVVLIIRKITKKNIESRVFVYAGKITSGNIAPSCVIKSVQIAWEKDGRFSSFSSESYKISSIQIENEWLTVKENL